MPRSIFARRSASCFSSEAMLAWAYRVRLAISPCMDRLFRSSPMWPTLPDNVKAGILALITAAVKPGEGSVVSERNSSQMAS